MIDNTETNNTDTLGKRIMALRKAAGMTQEQVAERLGVSPPGGKQVGERRILPRRYHDTSHSPAV